ncbi:Fe-S cluster assembly protein SufD [Caulobacter sp. NIBR1757]|uniref:Fe-S cluster assembly protein SufD n=1 Tax=Caulobacter sp. NIBR1757 TaxID=3016000 RepID=UPI0022F0FB3A|nr:Fe-S cluster assembly protein SufD [Caulobacter sp. NIBR1757]WGM39549.1 FeS cluster assembly protein SufD [Caulobacter sp. NIBR1757]
MSLSTALRTGDLAELPSRRDEDWRWTDLRGLIRKLPAASPEAVAPAGGPFAGLGEDLTVVNGRGVAALNIAGEGDHVRLLRFVSTTAGTGHHARIQVQVEAGASLTLLESYEGQAAGYIASAELDITLGEGARLERIVLAADDAEAINVSTAGVSLAAGSSYSQTVLTTGARRQRLETNLAHPGAQASVRLDGAYLLEGQRHADLTTTVTHGGVDGTTSQLTKGVARDQARGVFQGRIVVQPGADRTDARMRHQALILSERAEIDAKPELLIFADDVQCAHGNTVGALDEDAIFYAMQRGLPAERARAMLTAAFVGEVIDRIAHEGARAVAHAWAEQQLGEL